ncbi:MAG: acetyl-CoA carboxylase carboxyl transferase subunit alpha, partial [Steroidobacteraceae bacterium]
VVQNVERVAGEVDEIVPEPLGGAHRDPAAMGESLRQALAKHLADIEGLPVAELLERRRARIRRFGVYGQA